MRLAILGNGVLANLAALYLRKNTPEDTEITIVGPAERGKLPRVGESLIEISTRFLEEQLGLGQYLRKNHNPKFALTYYFKLDLDDPEDRTYSIHCNERAPDNHPPLEGWEGPMARPPAWLINREVFDRDMKQLVTDDPGIERIEGLAKDIELDRQAGHTITIAEANGEKRTLEADWVIDVTGRARFLGKRLGLIEKPKTGQRNCFWFHVEDFDADLLTALDALGPQPPEEGEDYHYDRYFTTHHFMGRGNWIWLIPVKGEDGKDHMSVGLTSRPDIYPHEVRSVEQFLEHVDKEHPVVADLVRSGTVEDTSILGNYRYFAKQAYSPDRWCLLGDSAYALDPLFSNGLAFGTIQIEQIGEMIRRDCEGELTDKLVNDMDKAIWAPLIASQNTITEWYASMDDPYLSALRLNWIEIAYFYMLLPMVVNRCHYDPKRMGLWNIMQSSAPPFEVPPQLIEARKHFDRVTPDHFIYRGKEKVNLRALEEVEKLGDIRSQIVEGSQLRQRYAEDSLAQLEVAAGAEA